MVVQNENSSYSYVGNGSTLIFQFGNNIYAENEIEVYVDDILKTYALDYRLEIDSQQRVANVIFYTAPETDSVVNIRRAQPLVQTNAFELNKFNIRTIEESHDKNMQAIQTLKLRLDELMAAVDDATNCDIQIFSETKTLSAGQVEVTFQNIIANAVVTITGVEVDNSYIFRGYDYDFVDGSKTLSLFSSYPAGTQITLTFNV